MLIKKQNHPDFVKPRFLSAGFYCIHNYISVILIFVTSHPLLQDVIFAGLSLVKMVVLVSVEKTHFYVLALTGLLEARVRVSDKNNFE